MFDKIKLYADLIIGGLLLLIVAGLLAFGLYEAHQVKLLNQSLGALQQQVSDLQTANRELTRQVQLAQTLAKVNDAVVTAAAAAHADMSAAQNTIAASTHAQIETVRKKYAAAPGATKTREQAHAESREISEIQINGLWKAYCTAVPADTTGCAEFTAPVNSTARPPDAVPSAAHLVSLS